MVHRSLRERGCRAVPLALRLAGQPASLFSRHGRLLRRGIRWTAAYKIAGSRGEKSPAAAANPAAHAEDNTLSAERVPGRAERLSVHRSRVSAGGSAARCRTTPAREKRQSTAE